MNRNWAFVMTLFSAPAAKIMSALLVFSAGCLLLSFTVAAERIRKTGKAPTSSIGKVQNPQATSGGAEAETTGNAEGRPPSALRHRDRAISTKDYKKLGNKSPGVTLHRVRAKPRKKSYPSKKKPNSVVDKKE